MQTWEDLSYATITHLIYTAEHICLQNLSKYGESVNHFTICTLYLNFRHQMQVRQTGVRSGVLEGAKHTAVEGVRGGETVNFRLDF